MAAALAEGDEEPDRPAVIDTVIVDPVLKAPLPVRELRERRARQPLGIVDDLVKVELGLLRPVARDDLCELLLGDVAGASCARRSPKSCTGSRTFFSMNVMMVWLSRPVS
jgi:hypothetical protein